MMDSQAMQNTKSAVTELDEELIPNDSIPEVVSSESRASQTHKDFGPLFESRVAEQLRAHWLEIQSHFVDNPNASLHEADELVTSMTENIISAFSEKRLALESQWQHDGQISTEDLRMVLKRYRTFFNRLLSLEY